MKTIELSTGTLLVVVLPEDAKDINVSEYTYGQPQDCIAFSSKIQDPFNLGGDVIALPDGPWQLLGHPSEITGEVWGKVVEDFDEKYISATTIEYHFCAAHNIQESDVLLFKTKNS